MRTVEHDCLSMERQDRISAIKASKAWWRINREGPLFVPRVRTDSRAQGTGTNTSSLSHTPRTELAADTHLLAQRKS